MNQLIMQCLFTSLNNIKRYLVISILMVNITAVAQAGQVFLQVDPAHKKNQAHYQLVNNSQALENTICIINDNLRLSQDMVVQFGEGSGPRFDPSQMLIYIPYHFLEVVTQRFEQDQTEGIDIRTAVEDVIVHTLFHELAHALITLYELPVVGQVENSADNLANVLLLEMLSTGGDVVLNAADLFALEGQSRTSFSGINFWAKHKLNEQRYYNALCAVYGHDPEANDELLKAGLLEAEYAERCIDDYEQMVRSWMRVLRKHWRGD